MIVNKKIWNLLNFFFRFFIYKMLTLETWLAEFQLKMENLEN
jgi:hypothetical protein